MINLTVHQKSNLDLILRDSVYCHKTVNRDLRFAMTDGSELNETELQLYIDNFDLLTPAKAEAFKRIDEQLQGALGNPVNNSYSRVEQDTFPYQRLEVEAWLKDNSALTPTIDQIAESRGVTRDIQIAKITAKTDYLTNLTNTNIGKAQGLKDQVKASSDLDLINSINFEA